MAAPIYKGGRPFIKPGIRIGNAVAFISGAGAPTNGTSGTGVGYAGPGSVYSDVTNKQLYTNTNTAASPTWSALSQANGAKSPAQVSSTPANPTQTSSATYVMMGLAVALTPVYSGRVVFMASGNIVATNGQTATAQLSFSTGTAPVNGAAVTGTQVGNQVTFTGLTGALTGDYGTQWIFTGAALGTALWLDIALKSSSGNVSLTNLAVSAFEI
jgi:hypothetical protein